MNPIRRFIGVVFLVVVIVGTIVPSSRTKVQAAPPGCDPRDLNGSYGVVARGFETDNGAPIALSIILNFDGAGNVSAPSLAFYSYGILVTFLSGSGAGGGQGYMVSPGTYIVYPDCSAYATLPGVPVIGQSPFNFFLSPIVIADSGREFSAVFSVCQPAVCLFEATGIARKQ